MAVAVFLLGSTSAAFAQRAVAPLPHNGSPAAAPVSLASHRAVYAITLARATQQDGVRAASGTTTYVLTDRCSGYTVESGMRLELGMSNGENSSIDQQYAAWEAKDNRTASFRMLTHENGGLKDSYHGSVALDETGAGKITYAGIGKDQTTVDLPPGTLLSTAHMVGLLKAASRGETFFSRPVVDGTFDDGPYRIAAVIGPAPHGPLTTGGANALESGLARPFGLAYFSLQSEGDEPRYELTMDLYPNGIARHMVQDFGGFTLTFDLVRVEPVTAPACS